MALRPEIGAAVIKKAYLLFQHFLYGCMIVALLGGGYCLRVWTEGPRIIVQQGAQHAETHGALTMPRLAWETLARAAAPYKPRHKKQRIKI